MSELSEGKIKSGVEQLTEKLLVAVVLAEVGVSEEIRNVQRLVREGVGLLFEEGCKVLQKRGIAASFMQFYLDVFQKGEIIENGRRYEHSYLENFPGLFEKYSLEYEFPKPLENMSHSDCLDWLYEMFIDSLLKALRTFEGEEKKAFLEEEIFSKIDQQYPGSQGRCVREALKQKILQSFRDDM